MSTPSTTGLRGQSRAFYYGRDAVISYPIDLPARCDGLAGIRTRVLEAGSGNKILVCLHGTGSRADRFSPPIPGLVAAGFHVFAIDLPGHGFADKPEAFDYSADGFAAVVADVLDHLGLSDVVLVGSSIGGHVAARVACDRPDLVDGLILIGATGIVEYPEEFNRPPESVARATPDVVRAKLEFLVTDPGAVTDAWVREESQINSSAGAEQAIRRTAEFLNSGSNQDLQAGRLNERTFSRPILLVWGSDDSWTPPSMAHEAAATLSSVRLEFMTGCGHAPYFEDPDTFVSLVSDHFGSGH